MITKNTLAFLSDLKKNNTREWFHSNKSTYDSAKQEFNSLMTALADELNRTDVLEDKKIFRINRDIRFSKDKSPYKSNLSGFFSRAGAQRRGGYYISIEPNGKTVVGGGFYAPEKEDLLRIRKEFEMDATQIEKITSDKNFIHHFGELRGERLKSAPRDFDKNHPNIHWINMKQFYAFREFTDKEVTSKTFLSEATNAFLAIRPFFDFMSDVLTTDLNGESIL